MNALQMNYQSAMGPLFLVASHQGLQGVFFKQQELPQMSSSSSCPEAEGWLHLASAQIEEYLAGKRTRFDIPLELIGTPFQKAVWQELRNIPYGETISYKSLAEKIKRPKAFRAVGTANGKNPLSLIIPCHRVIATDGTLGGYAWGLPLKSQLLHLEKDTAARFIRLHGTMPTS